jgi:hypothetical protein
LPFFLRFFFEAAEADEGGAGMAAAVVGEVARVG